MNEILSFKSREKVWGKYEEIAVAGLLRCLGSPRYATAYPSQRTSSSAFSRLATTSEMAGRSSHRSRHRNLHDHGDEAADVRPDQLRHRRRLTQPAPQCHGIKLSKSDKLKEQNRRELRLVGPRVASRMGDMGGGTLAATAAPPHLSPLPCRRLNEWPAKLEAREDGGGDHHQSRHGHPRWRLAGATPMSKPALGRRRRRGRRRPR
uniref:Uncharacterized protein n=1 Tax=Oryza glumipatula TaxID=40148 RepID=A0A0E0BLY9_9ORYZ